MPVIAVAAVVAAGAVASAAAKKRAAKKAASAQKKGIQQQEALLRKKLDPQAMNRLAQEVDRDRALNRIALQKEVDPEIAELREFSRQRLLDLTQQDQQARQSQQVADQLFRENIEADPQMERLKDTIIGRAQQEFDLGAQLPPEFQAEIVRTGLAQGGQSGIGVTREAVGGPTARLLGSAGIQLAQQRAAQGVALAGTADALAQSRQRLLSNIFPTVKVQEDSEAQRALQGFQLSEATLPESGLSGTDVVNIEAARQKGLAGLLGQRAGVNAGLAQMRGDFNAALIGAGTSLASAGLGAGIGGGGASIGGGAGGVNYGSLAQSIIGQGGSAAGITNNPYYGVAPGAVPYTYQGDPALLAGRRYI